MMQIKLKQLFLIILYIAIFLAIFQYPLRCLCHSIVTYGNLITKDHPPTVLTFVDDGFYPIYFIFGFDGVISSEELKNTLATAPASPIAFCLILLSSACLIGLVSNFILIATAVIGISWQWAGGQEWKHQWQCFAAWYCSTKVIETSRYKPPLILFRPSFFAIVSTLALSWFLFATAICFFLRAHGYQ